MMDDSRKVIFKAFSFPNASESGNSLFLKFTSYSSSTYDFEIGMEATKHYCHSVYSFLFERAFLSMLSIRFRLTAGIDAQKSANIKTILAILF